MSSSVGASPRASGDVAVHHPSAVLAGASIAREEVLPLSAPALPAAPPTLPCTIRSHHLPHAILDGLEGDQSDGVFEQHLLGLVAGLPPRGRTGCTRAALRALARLGNRFAHHLLEHAMLTPTHAIEFAFPRGVDVEELAAHFTVKRVRSLAQVVLLPTTIDRWLREHKQLHPTSQLNLDDDARRSLMFAVRYLETQVIQASRDTCNQSNSAVLRSFDVHRALLIDVELAAIVTYLHAPYLEADAAPLATSSLSYPKADPFCHAPFPIRSPFGHVLSETFDVNATRMQKLNAKEWYFDPDKVKKYAQLYAECKLPPGDAHFFRLHRIKPLAFYGCRRYPLRGTIGPTNDEGLPAVNPHLICRVFSFELLDSQGQAWPFVVELCGTGSQLESPLSPDGWIRCESDGITVGFVDHPHDEHQPSTIRCLNNTVRSRDLIQHFYVDGCVQAAQVAKAELCLRDAVRERVVPQRKRLLDAMLDALHKAETEDANMEAEETASSADAATPHTPATPSAAPSSKRRRLSEEKHEDASMSVENAGGSSSSDFPASPSPPPGLSRTTRPFSAAVAASLAVIAVDQPAPVEGEPGASLPFAPVQPSAVHERAQVEARIELLLAQLRTERSIAAAQAERVHLELRWKECLSLSVFEHHAHAPQLFHANHPLAVRATFTAALVDTQMRLAGFAPLPSVLLQLIGEYEPAVLPFVDEELTPTESKERADERLAFTQLLIEDDNLLPTPAAPAAAAAIPHAAAAAAVPHA